MSVEDEDRDRLARECAELADEIDALRAVVEIKERMLERASHRIEALELERAELERELERASPATRSGVTLAPDLSGASETHERPRASEIGRLILGEDSGGPRHFLAGRAVRAGAMLELRALDGAWIAGCYEWSFREGDAPKFCGVIAASRSRCPPRRSFDGRRSAERKRCTDKGRTDDEGDSDSSAPLYSIVPSGPNARRCSRAHLYERDQARDVAKRGRLDQVGRKPARIGADLRCDAIVRR